jgi:hypothetical protein
MFKDLKEDITDWFESVKDNIKLFGFWGATWWALSGFFWKNTYWFRQIKRIVEYIPILWADADWDYNYIFYLLKYKLQRTRKEIAKGSGDDEQWIKPRTAEIDEAIRLIDQIMDNNFVEKEHEEHEAKYGSIKMETGEKDEKTGCFRADIYFEKTVGNEELKNLAHEDSAKIFELEEQRTQKALDDLFNHLSKNIRKWWD